MQGFLVLFDSALAMVRVALLGAAAVLAAVCAADWLVRTRRLSPFSPVARFMRNSVDPLLRPVERRVVRAGGLPSSAPWWALAAVVLAGIVTIWLLGFVRAEILYVHAAMEGGPGAQLGVLLNWAFTILELALIVRVVLSWIPLRPGAWYWRWSFALTEPMLRPLRRIVPMIGMIDITPIVAWFLLGLLQGALLRAM